MVKVTEFNVFGSNISVYKQANLKKFASEYGHFDSENKRIVIDSKMDNKDTITTLIHEIFHAMIDRLHIQIPFSLEEQLCEAVATMIWDNFIVTLRLKPSS